MGAGNEERGFLNVRYGGEWGTGTYGRVYAKLFARDALVDKAGNPAEDDWRMGCGGFRLDRNLERGRLTWQGGFYQVLHLYQLAGWQVGRQEPGLGRGRTRRRQSRRRRAL